MPTIGPYLIQETSEEFSLLVIGGYSYVTRQHKEFIMSKQLLRCGTSVGANIKEAQEAQSKKDFLHKMNIALKEAKETVYRLTLLSKSGYLAGYPKHDETIQKSHEILRVLIKIVKTTKQSIKKTP